MTPSTEIFEPADVSERERAATTFDRNLVVTAGAGTGKTTLLVDRLVHLLMRDYDPSLVQAPAYADFDEAATCQTLIAPPTRRRLTGRSFFRDVLQSAFARRYDIGSYRLYRRWFQREYTPKQRLKSELIEVLGRLDLGEDVLDPPVGSDDERRSFGAHVRSPGEALLDPHAVRLRQSMPFVR